MLSRISQGKIKTKLNNIYKYYIPKTDIDPYYIEIKKLINNFNKKNKDCKISSIGELAEQMSIYWKKWIFLAKRLKTFTNFKHKLYSKRYENLIYKEIIS